MFSYFGACCIALILIGPASSLAQSSRMQFIHNSADVQLQVIDVWASNVKVIDNLAYLEATALFTLQDTGALILTITDSASTDTLNAFKHFNLSLQENEGAQCILQGLYSQGIYASFDPLTLVVNDTLTEASTSEETFIRWVFGSTDAAPITLTEIKNDLGVLAEDMPFNAQLEAEYPTSNYRLRMTGGTSILREYDFYLSEAGIDGRAITTIVSGFEDPASNADGPPISISAYDGSGVRYSFELSKAAIQFIHNSADPHLASIDVYVNDERLVNDLDFRGTTGYLAVPSGSETLIEIVDGIAVNNASPLLSVSRSFASGDEHVGILAGNNGTGFDPEVALRFDLHLARRTSQIGNGTDILFYQGSTDLGNAYLYESSLVKSIIHTATSFGQFSDHIALPYTDYRVDLTNAASDAIEATYDLNLTQFSNLEGGAITLMTSGYRDTATNQGGESLGLWYARPSSGLMIELSLSAGTSNIREPQMVIYPIPTKDQVNIQSKENLEWVTVYDLSGRELLQQAASGLNTVVDLSPLPTSSYMLIVKTANGIHRQLVQTIP